MSPSELADAVKDKAALLGFDACGIAEATAIDPEHRLAQWLDAGYHASMEWMRRTCDVRTDVSRKLPCARSVIVVARNYFANRPEPVAGAGRVSRYAWGRDYHRVLEKPLRKLAAFVTELEPGTGVYPCVDSGPVMEKAWAERAGVGWIGKNSLLLRRELGSYFFLGAIVTTARIAPDSPVPDLCGGCTLCIDACPTQAIVQPKVVDARRCISYHTIENRGDVPDELAEKFGDWVFGCDVCQDVCPWNRKLRETTEADFLPRPGNAHLRTEEISALDERDFLARFAGTPIMRAKLAGLKRNARIVAENQSVSVTTVNGGARSPLRESPVR
ncbi:MAG: tRNA epoxyqueuosine(34) reductase QueG [Candidatus Hydrogenedentes bacterium]|nr:tRNA epoxyqueuosine(34) reductase QueG [Candidatus Hydrogenedentota bacterium]